MPFVPRDYEITNLQDEVEGHFQRKLGVKLNQIGRADLDTENAIADVFYTFNNAFSVTVFVRFRGNLSIIDKNILTVSHEVEISKIMLIPDILATTLVAGLELGDRIREHLEINRPIEAELGFS